MLDIKFIRENPKAVRQAIRAKQLHGAEAELDALLRVDEEHRAVRADLETKQAERNARSQQVGELKRAGENADAVTADLKSLSDAVKQGEAKARALEAQLHQLMLEMPNLPHDSVPYGENEAGNQVVYERGSAPEFTFTPKPHWELAAARGWLDLEAGVKVTGAGFPVFKGPGARFVRALVQYFLDTLGEAGYVEVNVPLLVNTASATATGQLPDKEGQMYEVTDGFFLIPTSEVSVTNIHRGEILDLARLPVKYCAYTPNFRREAGSYGKEVRGINRVHQFDKVEMVQLVHPDTSYDVLEEMTATAEAMLSSLGLRHRRLLMCSGDMGFTQAKKYDLEVWSAGQDRWLEVSSCSNITSFQARRLGTRFRAGGVQGKGKTEFVHTLNGSALALPRTIAAIIEHYQNEDGTVTVPDAIRPYFSKAQMQ